MSEPPPADARPVYGPNRLVAVPAVEIAIPSGSVDELVPPQYAASEYNTPDTDIKVVEPAENVSVRHPSSPIEGPAPEPSYLSPIERLYSPALDSVSRLEIVNAVKKFLDTRPMHSFHEEYPWQFSQPNPPLGDGKSSERRAPNVALQGWSSASGNPAPSDPSAGSQHPPQVTIREPNEMVPPFQPKTPGRLARASHNTLKGGFPVGSLGERPLTPGPEPPTETEHSKERAQSKEKTRTDLPASERTTHQDVRHTSSQPVLDQFNPLSDNNAEIWPLYLEHALLEDKETVQTWNSDLDAILIFAALFSAVLTTLVVESYTNLQPDPQVELLQAILIQLQRANNATTSDSEAMTSVVPPFQLTGSTIRVNVYWFSSLIVSLSTALIAILAKQWVNYLLAGLSPVPTNQGRHRQYRMDGLHKWKLPALLSFLPLMLHIALLLFFVGLVDFVWDLNGVVAIVSLVLVIATFLLYASANLLSYIYPECPFKTSVTVFIALAHEFIINLYARLVLSVQFAWETVSTSFDFHGLPGHIRHFSDHACLPRDNHTSNPGSPISDLSISALRVEKSKAKYNTSRISYLRHQDEQFIAQNASLVDSRVLLWLIHNVDRLARPEELGNALMHFPHLIRHRQLFIQEGASGAFLERLLRSWFTGRLDTLPRWQYNGIHSVVRTLAMLLSEAEVDGPEYECLKGGTAGISGSNRTPFLLIQRYQQRNGPDIALSRETSQILGHLLVQVQNLPLPFASFVLRLSVQRTGGEDQGILLLSIRQSLGSDIVQTFINRIKTSSSDPRLVGARTQLIPAINTVIYLALWDTVNIQRDGPQAGLLSPNHGISQWLETLVDITRCVPMHGTVIRQLIWGICVLSWTLSTQAKGMAACPLIPRMKDMQQLQDAALDLVSCDQNPKILLAVLVALEYLVWNANVVAQGDHHQMCLALQSCFGEFLGEFYTRLKKGVIKTEDPYTFRTLASISRITVYLAFFDTHTSQLRGREGVQTSLSALMLSTFNTFLRQRAQYVHNAKTKEITPAGPQTQGTIIYARTAASKTPWWLYKAACAIVALQSRMAENSHRKGNMESETREMLFDASSTKSLIGGQLVIAVMALSLNHVDKGRCSLQPYTLQAFCDLLRHLVADEIYEPEHKIMDMRDIGGRDEAVVDVVNQAVKTHKLLSTLLASPHVAIHVGILAPFVHHIYTSIFSGTRTIIQDAARRGHPPTARADVGTRIRRNDTRHPAYQTAIALRNVWRAFLQRFTMELNGGSHVYPEMHGLLIELIGISGYMVFFDRSDEAPQTGFLQDLLQYLRELVRHKNTPFALRRHAWYALGSTSQLYLYGFEKLTRDDNPLRYFCRDNVGDEDIATGLIRILTVKRVQVQGMTAPHCRECALDMNSEDTWRIKYVPDMIVEMALEMMVDMWDAADWESLDIRRELLSHHLERRVRLLRNVEARIGILAHGMSRRIARDPTTNEVGTRITRGRSNST